MLRIADDFAETTPWDITPTDLSGWLASHDWAPDTLRSHRSVLRSF